MRSAYDQGVEEKRSKFLHRHMGQPAAVRDSIELDRVKLPRECVRLKVAEAVAKWQQLDGGQKPEPRPLAGGTPNGTYHGERDEDDLEDQETLASQQSQQSQQQRTGPIRDFSVAMPRLSSQEVDLRLLPQQVKAALDFLVAMNPVQVVPDAMSDSMPVLLPPQQEAHRGRRTLVLDLDETLVHCHGQPTELKGASPCPDIFLELDSGNPLMPMVLRANLYVRPFSRRFLRFAAKHFEVVVFTASASIYADRVLDYLDPGRDLVAHRLYREGCTEIAGGHFKDLRRLGRPLKDVVLVDNSPLAPGLAPDNGLLVTSWYGDDQKDVELLPLMFTCFRMLREKSWPEYLAQRYGFRDFLEELRANAAARATRVATQASMVRMQMIWSSTGAVTQVRR